MNCPSCGHENRYDARFCGECAAPLADELACPSCHAQLPEDATFCGHCGSRLSSEQVCGSCGRSNPQAMRFCLGCGNPLGETPPSPPERDPRDYTPKHLAEKILHGKSALEGERKQVTVLFADVKGSMDLAEQVDPEEWHRILNRFFEILTDGVHRFEGTVNQYTGDGIMALFGAPIAHEDHAQRACYAALHLTDEIRRYARDLRRERGLNFSARMGLNSGEVVVGKIGDDLRMDYTARGHTVGLAARMEQLAEPGKVYLTEHTATLVSGYFELEELGQFAVPGARESVGVRELQGVGRLRTRLDLARARGFTRFVGRAHEIQILETALAQALEGKGQVVGVVGEAGVGKSRLCLEFVEGCRAQGIPVHEAHCPAHGKSVPFLPVLELFRSFFAITDQDDPAEARRKIAGTLVLLDEAFQETLPLVFEFLGVSDPERPFLRIDPEARQRQLFALVRQLFEARSRREPTVTLLDDLHWIDAGSDAFVAQAVEAVSGTRTLLLTNFRPEYDAPWMSRSHYQQVPLLPLGPGAVSELLDDLIGSHPSLTPLREQVQSRTGGNPFFVEEMVQSLIETGSLRGSRGDYRLVEPIERVALPSTVQTVLAARIDRLAEREKRVLQVASVIGREIPEQVLRLIAEMPDLELRSALSELTRAEFMVEKALYPEAEYAFKHPLTHEVAYGSQLAERRKPLHAGVARAIEELQPDKHDENAALLAHHWEQADETLPAARWHRRAAEWVMFRDMAEAHRHWQKVRELSSALPESAETLALSVAAHVQLVNLGWRLGASVDEMETLLLQGRALAEKADDPRSLALLLSNYALVGSSQHIDGSLTCYREAVRLAEQVGDRELRVTIGCVLAPFVSAGRLKEALELSERYLELARSDAWLGVNILYFSPYNWLRLLRPYLLGVMGRLDEGREESERALGLPGPAELEIFNAAYAHAYRSMVAWLTGEPSLTVQHARRSVEFAEKDGTALTRAIAYNTLAAGYILNAEWEQAIPVLEETSKIWRELGHHGRNELVGWLLTNAYMGAGDLERAEAAASEAAAGARDQGTKLVELTAQIALARVLVRREGAAAQQRIEAAISRAELLAEETAARIWEPQILIARAELSHALGDDETEQRHLRQAHRLFTEMGATGHAERLAHELGL